MSSHYVFILRAVFFRLGKEKPWLEESLPGWCFISPHNANMPLQMKHPRHFPDVSIITELNFWGNGQEKWNNSETHFQLRCLSTKFYMIENIHIGVTKNNHLNQIMSITWYLYNQTQEPKFFPCTYLRGTKRDGLDLTMTYLMGSKYDYNDGTPLVLAREHYLPANGLVSWQLSSKKSQIWIITWPQEVFDNDGKPPVPPFVWSQIVGLRASPAFRPKSLT
jgi:hypothetical protein